MKESYLAQAASKVACATPNYGKIDVFTDVKPPPIGNPKFVFGLGALTPITGSRDTFSRVGTVWQASGESFQVYLIPVIPTQQKRDRQLILQLSSACDSLRDERATALYPTNKSLHEPSRTQNSRGRKQQAPSPSRAGVMEPRAATRRLTTHYLSPPPPYPPPPPSETMSFVDPRSFPEGSLLGKERLSIIIIGPGASHQFCYRLEH